MDSSRGEPPSPSGPDTGRVVSAFGKRLTVEDDRGRQWPAFVARRGLRVVCGDRVVFEPAGDDAEAAVTDRLPRTNELTRPDRRGRVEVLAANIDRIVVVVAPEPPTDPFVTDRYLAAAETMGCDAVVVVNKSDLPAGDDLPLEEYARLGYPVLRVSAASGEGLEALGRSLAGHTSILVGQSGVGKSSLVNALVPGGSAAIQSLSRSTGEGRHTTTASVLHALPEGGGLIDSPGVRDYAPALDDPAIAVQGFREIGRLAGECRFGNCRHLREPGCAVKAAVESGAISRRRYESYRRLRRLIEEVAKPGWA